MSPAERVLDAICEVRPVRAAIDELPPYERRLVVEAIGAELAKGCPRCDGIPNEVLSIARSGS